MNKLEQIAAWGIPTDNVVVAVQAARNHDQSSGLLFTPPIDKTGMEERVTTLLGYNSMATFSNEKTARIAYAYAIQQTILTNGNPDAAVVEAKVKALVAEMPWTVADYEAFSHTAEGPVKLDAMGNTKVKKGAKKALAIEVYNREKGTERNRQEWLALLMAEVGLSKAGASTYYAALKNGSMS